MVFLGRRERNEKDSLEWIVDSSFENFLDVYDSAMKKFILKKRQLEILSK